MLGCVVQLENALWFVAVGGSLLVCKTGLVEYSRDNAHASLLITSKQAGKEAVAQNVKAGIGMPMSLASLGARLHVEAAVSSPLFACVTERR